MRDGEFEGGRVREDPFVCSSTMSAVECFARALSIGMLCAALVLVVSLCWVVSVAHCRERNA